MSACLLARGRLLQPYHHRLVVLRLVIATPTTPTPVAAHQPALVAAASGRSTTAMATTVGAHGTPSEADLLARLRAVVPPLSSSAHKGSHGKVGVVGGCAEYTGAPYFSALAALRAGADLAYVFCTPAAAPVIKSYSPELIVLPCLPFTPSDGERAHRQGGDGSGSGGKNSSDDDDGDAEAAAASAEPWVSRLGCLVVGPGLGDDPRTVAAARLIMLCARRRGVPLVIDGSAINFVAKHVPALVQGERRCVLTPNLAEFGRLATGAGVSLKGGNERITVEWQAQAGELARALGGPVVVSKGPADVVAVVGAAAAAAAAAGGGQQQQQPVLLTCTSPASLKRSGGQGDVLTGIMATLICWTFGRRKSGGDGDGGDGGGGDDDAAATSDALALAAWGACWLMRAASATAFAAKGRSMLAEDILDPHVADAIAKLERSGGRGGGGAAA